MTIKNTFTTTNLNIVLNIVGWYFFSLSISIYNKWMFGNGLDFKFPVIVTSFHQFFLMITSGTALWLLPSLRPAIDKEQIPLPQDEVLNTKTTKFLSMFKMGVVVYITNILPCALASAGDLGLSNVSFRFVTLSLYTMLKTSSLMFVLIFGLLFKLEKFHWRLVVIVLTMTISLMLLARKDSQLSENSGDTHAIGVVLVIGAAIISGLRWSLTQILLKHNEFTCNPIAMIFFLAPSMCSVLLILGLLIEGGSNFINASIWETKGILGSIVLLTIPGLFAFLMTLFEFRLLSVAQVVSLSIAGIFKELLTILMGALVFGDKLTILNYIGLIISFSDIIWYNFHRYQENKVACVTAKVLECEDEAVQVRSTSELLPTIVQQRKDIQMKNL